MCIRDRVVDEYVPDGKLHMTRNPYYWKVDPNGNQLPYFDEFEILIAGDRPAVGLGNMTGEYDHDHMWTGFPHYSMWLEEQGKTNRDYSIGFSNAPGMKISFNFDAEDKDARTVNNDSTPIHSIFRLLPPESACFFKTNQDNIAATIDIGIRL